MRLIIHIHVKVAEIGVEVTASVEYPYYANDVLFDPKCNGRATFKSDHANARRQIVTFGATFRKSSEGHAGGLDSGDVIVSACLPRPLAYIAINSEEVGFSLGTEADLIYHRRFLSWSL
jgi:hypothetical protein